MSLYIRYSGTGTGSGGGGGGGTPSSPANSIQFNNAGAFGGSSNLLYNSLSGYLYTLALQDSSGIISVDPTNRRLENAAATPVFSWGGAYMSVGANIDYGNTYTNTSLPLPVNSGDAASKQYVDNSILALQPKAQVAVATTGPITLSGLQLIDGYTTLPSDRVLVKNQGSGIANGIYIASVGPWTRSADFAAGQNVVGAYMAVANGTANGNKSFIQSANPGIVGTNALTFNVFNSNLYAASGQGIVLTGGNVFALQIDGTTLTQSGAGVKVGDLSLTDSQISLTAGIALSKLGLLVGYSSTTGTITTSDTVVSAISKLNGNIGALTTGVSSVFGRSAAVIAQAGDYNTSQVTELTNLYFTDLRAISAPLTGYVSGAGTILATDSILQAIQKLNGNIATLPSYTFSQSVQNVLNTITLVNDVTAPGNSFYYGTNASGTKGFYVLPNPTTFTFSNSINNSSGTITLVNDVTSPGNSYYYGTNSSGTKGWYSFSGVPTYTFSTGLTNTASVITANISTGITGGQTIYGGTAASDNLTISSTTNATKGKVIYDSQINWTTGLGAITHILGPTDQTLAIATPTSATVGRAMSLTAANGTAGAGGAITLTGGNASNTSGANGGSITLTSGNAVSTAGSASSGNISLICGTATSGTGTGGNIILTAGSAGNSGVAMGQVQITSGTPLNTASVSGDIILTTPATTGPYVSGSIKFNSGNGGPLGGNAGGMTSGGFVFTSGTGVSNGTGTGGQGGPFTVTLGNGGFVNGSNPGGAGGDFSFTSGTGGAQNATTGTNTAGRGGNFTFTGGTGGSAGGSGATTNTGGAGGSFNVTGGTGGTGSNATTNNAGVGGTITLTGGTGGSGQSGHGGNVALVGGASGPTNNPNGGSITLTGGANSIGNGVGGDITLTAGAANGNATRAGNISLVGATPPGASGSATYVGSTISITAGTGKGSTSTSGSSGGPVNITSGAGGANTSVTGTNTAGAAGAVVVTTGAGGAATGIGGTANTGGAGGNLSVVLGQGGAASGATTNTIGASGQITVSQTLSGSDATSMLALSPTWNTTGVPTCINVNLTDTASGAGAKWLNFTNGTSNTYLNRITTSGGLNETVLFATNGTNSLTMGVGNGGATSAGVNFIKTNATTSLTISASNIGIPVGSLYMTGTAGTNLIVGQQAAATANTALKLASNTIGAGVLTMTTGTQIDVMIGGVNNYQFAPTSGTATYTQLSLTPVINQTGGANGITRSVYVNPTLTAAADYRALETANGKVLFTDTYSAGSGSLAGTSFTVAPTWNTSGNPTAMLLNVTNTASGATSRLLDLQTSSSTKFYVDKTGATYGAQGFSPLTDVGANLGQSTQRFAHVYVTDINSGTNGCTFTGAGGTNTYQFSIQPSTSTLTAGTFHAVEILQTYNQAAATTVNTDLYIQRTETAVGSGAQKFIDCLVGASSKFSVSNGGVATANGLTLNGSTSGAITQNAATSTTSYTVKWPAAQGGANTYLKNDGSGNLTWGSSTVSYIAPTVQKFTSGSGTYTTPVGVLYIKVTMVGGGGGGGGGASTAGGVTAGTDGNDTTFGSSFLTANGGKGATITTYPGGGAGGAATIGAGASGLAIIGGGGSGPADGVNALATGGVGGGSYLGGAGQTKVNTAGSVGAANTGGGGGGGGANASTTQCGGGGGGSGGAIVAIITSPGASYAYAVGAGGAGGAAGTSGTAGGTGGSGVIMVEEFYQ